MSRHSHRRSRQSPAMVSPSSLLVTVLPPPCPGRFFLVWRVPPHCCSLPPQGLAAAPSRAAFFGLEGPSSLLLFTTPGSCRRPIEGGFFWLSRLACRSQRCPLTSQGFRRLVGDRLRRANGAAGAPAALLELPHTAQESFGLPSPGRAQLLQRMLGLGRNPRRSA